MYQRGAFGPEATDLVSEAMVWWSISLPFQGVSLLFSRTFFSLQRPWATTALAGLNLAVNAVLAAALYGPFGIGGIVLGTVAGHGRHVRRAGAGCCAASWVGSRGAGRSGAAARDAAGGPAPGRRGLRRLVRARRRARPVVRRLRRCPCSSAITAGVVAYAAAVWVLRVPEARQIRRLLMSRRAASG